MQSFDEWFQEFKICAKNSELPINEEDEMSYWGYFDDDYSPQDAVRTELSYLD